MRLLAILASYVHEATIQDVVSLLIYLRPSTHHCTAHYTQTIKPHGSNLGDL